MTTYPDPTAGSCPVHDHTPPRPPGGLTPIYGEAFSADPHATYRWLRTQAPITPVEIAPGLPAYLAVTYRAALYLLRNNPTRFAKDTNHWEALQKGQVPADSPVLAMMQPRDNALWKDGAEHARLRRAITFSLARVDTSALADTVARIADQLIDAFAGTGHADLIAQYADPLSVLVVINQFGSPPALGQRIVHDFSSLFDAGADAARANVSLEAACLELTQLKRRQPGKDIPSSLIASGLTDAEVIATIMLLVGAAGPPCGAHIGNGLRRVLTDERFAGSVHDGVRPLRDALDEVLWDNPPLANYSPLFAIGSQSFEGIYLQPGIPILVSFAAANGDPLLAVDPAARAGNRGHLAFGAGAHACPAPDIARIISETALERALDRLPGLDLAVPERDLRNRPGTFQAGLLSLPVHFQPDNRFAPPRR
ncbi:cytochrome P450 [Streptomyces sp. NPDC046994]|uniref:cytochrome P450 n=1 Tax=Streptomyces sp. NPDC046994 TaxID=3155735 RepID=UPI003456E096